MPFLPHCVYVGCSKNKVIFFSKNIYLFINIYIVLFKVIPLRYNTLVPALFPILEARFGIVLSSSSNAVFISSVVANLLPFKGLFSFGIMKSCRGPILVNMVAEAWLWWPKNYKQAMACELVIANNRHAHQNTSNLFFICQKQTKKQNGWQFQHMLWMCVRT